MGTTASMSSISAILSVFIFVPVSVYGNIQLYKHRNETFMQNRSLPIAFGLNTCFIAMLVVYPLVPIIFYSASNTSYRSTSFIPVLVVWWMLLLFLNLRNWLIYFKSHWTYHTVQLQWQQIINPNIKNKKNWFIDNHEKYGNVSNILKRFVISHFIGFIISMAGVLFVFNGHLANEHGILSVIGMLCIILSLSVSIIFYSIILYKTPTFISSHVFIHWESKIQSKLLVIAIILKVCSLIHAELQIVAFYASSTLLSSIMCLVFFAMNYVSTFLLIKKNTTQKTNEDDDDDVIDITLNDILGNKQAVHLFMVYLTTEFSLECLLSFIEMAQYQKYILELMEAEGVSIPITIETVISHSNIPKSLILEKTVTIATVLHKTNADKRLYDAKMRAHKLYNKYIRIDSEFEINISSLLREKLTETLDDKQQLVASSLALTDLLELFEKPKNEMKKLLRYSYFRFKYRKQFEQVVILFANRKEEEEKQNMDGIEIVYVAETNNRMRSADEQQGAEHEHDENKNRESEHQVQIDNELNQNGLEILYDYNEDNGDDPLQSDDVDYIPPRLKLMMPKSTSNSECYVKMESMDASK